MKKTKKPAFFGLFRLQAYFRPYRRAFVVILLYCLLSGLAEIVVPLFPRYALDRFVAGGTLAGLWPFIAAYVAVIVFSGFCNYRSSLTAAVTEVSVNRDLRDAAFTHLQTLSFSYFSQNSVGYIHARLMSDTEKIGSLVSWTLMDAVWYISYLVGSAIVMLRLNARLAMLVLAVLPLVGGVFALFERGLVRASRDVRASNAVITGNFNEGITGAKTIKSLAIEDRIGEDFTRETAVMRRRSVRTARLRGAFAAVISFASGAAIAILLWKGGRIAREDVGTFAAFIAYAQGMMEPVRWLVAVISDLIAIRVNVERVADLLETQSDVVDAPAVIEKYGDTLSPKKENWEPVRGDIAFRDVTFRYPDGDVNVLEHFSLDVPFGTHLAIVGQTGAGKTTLANLVCRFYDPTEGQVLIDGRDARERSQLWLHEAIGCVLQTPHLFSGSIRDNLKMGDPDADDDRLWEALTLVSADDVVRRLEKGLDTDVGEGGDLLSTGEKQLISFARALLADPRILILDEATASVDTLTESRIRTAMARITRGRTAIMIAHRLSTVQDADHILVVKDGVIVEQGDHRSLMADKGYYYELYARQYQDETAAKLLSGGEA